MNYYNKTILLVEDENINARLGAKTLQKNGYHVIHSSTGEKAVEIVNTSSCIDLILMDIDLGDGIDGTRAAEIILAGHDIPLIFLSSHTDPEIVEKTEDITSYGYILKHSGETVLLASIKMAFRLFESKKKEKEKEKKLKKSEEQYRSIFENTGTSIFLVESDMNISMVNGEFERRFGYCRNDVVGKMKWTELVHEESLQFMLTQHRLRREEEGSALSKYEIKYITRIGEVRHGILSVGMIPGTDKSIASLTDITELKNAEYFIREQKDQLLAVNEELAATNEELNASIEEFEAVHEELINTNSLYEEKERESRFLFETSSSGIFIVQKGKLAIFNQAVAGITGYSEDELVSKSLISFIHPEDSGLAEEHYNRIIKNCEIETSSPLRLITHDNRIKWIGIKSRLILWRGEKSTLNFINDITERKEAEDDLRISENKYRRIFENIQDVFYQTDMHGIITEVSPSIEAYSGFTRDELIGKSVLSVYFETSERDRLVNILLTHGKVIDHELVLKTKDNKVIFSSTSSSIILDEFGQPRGFEGVLRDISDRKKIEEALRNSNEKMQAIFDIANIGISITDIDGKYIMFNRWWSNHLGYEYEEMMNMSIDDLTHPDDVALSKDLFSGLIAGENNHYRIEKRYFRKDKSFFWGDLSVSAVRDIYGKVVNMVGMIQDVTDRKRGDEMIRSLLKEKQLLLKETHHRIKNNMSTIRGILYLQAEEQDDSLCSNILYDASSRVQSMMVLYDKLYRLDNYNELDVSTYLPDLINEIIGIFDLSIPVETDIRVDELILNAKYLSSIGIIINELITNSMKYAFKEREKGLISLFVSKNGDEVTLVYRDDGIGLPGSVEIENPGSFGMELIAMLVQQINGTVEIDRDNGTGFVITFTV